MNIIPADAGNAIFELAGAAFVTLSILKLADHKLVRGIAWPHVGFFTAWGWWNIYYYWAMGSPLSWYAGVFLTIVNSIYTWMLIHYVRKESR